MAKEKGSGKFFVYCSLILILFLVMVPVIFSFKGKLIRAEILVLLFLMLLSLVGFAGYKKSWGEKVLFFMFLVGLANAVFIWHFTSRLFMLPLLLLLVGFLMALPKKKEDGEMISEGAGPCSEVFKEEKERTPPTKARSTKAKVEYTPGKYVGSKMGNVYHEPKCEWAKKIAEARRVWFKDKKEAQKKGYKVHRCVE